MAGKAGKSAVFKVAQIALAATATVICLLTGAPEAAAQAWQEFRSAGLGFKVDMPGAPKIFTEWETMHGLKVEINTAEVEHPPAGFSVCHTEYPRGWIASGAADDLLEDWRRRMEKTLGVKVTRENRFTTNAPIGELVIASDGFHLIGRMYVVGDGVIEVTVTSLRGLEDNPAAQRFLGSFKLL